MKKLNLKILGAFASLLFLAACYPIGPTYVEDYDVVYTVLPDKDFDFSDPTITTYFLPDTVVDHSDPDDSPNPVGDQDVIIDEIVANMDALGYTRITDPNDLGDVDYIVLSSVSRADNYYYTWWGGGWGYWGYWGYWGWGGCCYYPVSTVSNIRTGSLIVEIIDAKQLSPSTEIAPMVWIGLGEGLYEGGSTNITQRGKKAINQMFNQSPYLKR